MIFNFLFLSTKEQNMQYSDIKKIFAKPPEQRTEEECKLLAKAYTEECCSNGNTALINAICDKDTKIALALIDAGADINAIDNFSNPALIHACLWGDKNVTSAFIAAGAIIDARNKYDQTALMHAASKGHTDTALALIKAGADVNATDQDGNTALIHAALKRYTDTALALIAKGADINATNHSGHTALIYARLSGYIDTALALIAKGADIKATNKSYTDLVSDLIATHLVEKIQPKFKKIECLLGQDTSIHSMKDLAIKRKKQLNDFSSALYRSLDDLKLLPAMHIDSNLIALKVLKQLQLPCLPKPHIMSELINSIVTALYQLFLILTLDNNKDKKIILFTAHHNINKALNMKARDSAVCDTTPIGRLGTQNF